MHEERRLDTLEAFDFPALLEKSATEQKVVRSRAALIELLRVEGDRAAQWVEALSDAFMAERVRLPGVAQ